MSTGATEQIEATGSRLADLLTTIFVALIGAPTLYALSAG